MCTKEAIKMHEVFGSDYLSEIIGMKVLDIQDDLYDNDSLSIFFINNHGVMCELLIEENGSMHLSEVYARTESEHFELMQKCKE